MSLKYEPGVCLIEGLAQGVRLIPQPLPPPCQIVEVLTINGQSCGGSSRFPRPESSPGSGCRVQGSGFRVQGSGFRVQGSGFRVQGQTVTRHDLRRGTLVRIEIWTMLASEGKGELCSPGMWGVGCWV